ACWIYGPFSCVTCCQSGAILTSWRSTQHSAGCMWPPSPGSWRCSRSGTAPSRSSAGTVRRKRTRSRSMLPHLACTCGSAASPAACAVRRTGGGRLGPGTVQPASDAPGPPNVLAQVDSDRTDYRFPVAAARSPSFTDGSVSVKCEPVSGRVDRACGLVFRYQDENNYYLTRANALEDNVRFYYVKNGRRIQLANWTGTDTSRVC